MNLKNEREFIIPIKEDEEKTEDEDKDFLRPLREFYKKEKKFIEACDCEKLTKMRNYSNI